MENLFSIEVEQNLLGALLCQNNLLVKVASIIRPDDFAYPIHTKIYSAICKTADAGRNANAITIKSFFNDDPDLKELGGDVYVFQLEANAVAIASAPDYAEIVRDFSLRRALVAAADGLKAEAQSFERDVSARQIAAEFIGLVEKTTQSNMGSTVTAEAIIEQIAQEASKPAIVTPTGLSRLDAALAGGLHAGRLYAISAYMKAGKTALMATIAYNQAINGRNVLYLCLEMTGREVMQRILARHVDVNALAFLDQKQRNSPEMLEKYKKAAAELNYRDFSLSFEDMPGVDLNLLIARLSEAGASGKYDGIVVDYLQLVTGAIKNENDAAFQARVAQRIAEVTKKWPKMWILTAAQLNRDGMLRGSDGLRMACDVLLSLKTTAIADPHGGEQIEAWLEMEASRYTPFRDVGTEAQPAYSLNKRVGPFYEEL